MKYPLNFSDYMHHSQEYLHIIEEFEDFDDNKEIISLVHSVKIKTPEINKNKNIFLLKKKKKKIIKLQKSLKFKSKHTKRLTFNFTIFLQKRNVFKDQDESETVYEKLKVSNYLDQTTILTSIN